MYASPAADTSSPDWPAIASVVLGVTGFAVAQGLTYPLLSLILQSRGASGTLIGLNAGSFAAGLAVSTILVGPLTARIRGDRLIILGLIGCSLCLATFALFEAMWIWFVARFLLGFCASVIFMLSEAWLNVSAPDRLRGRVSGLYGFGMCVGFAAGPLAIPVFGTEGGLAFAILSIYVALVAFAIVLLSRSARTEPGQSRPGDLIAFMRSAPVLICMVVAFGFADIAAISGMPVYFVKTGHSPAFAALSVTVMTLPTAFAQLLVGWCLDNTPRRAVAAGCGAIAGLSFLAIPLLQAEPAILIAFALMGAASFGLYTCALTLLGQSYAGGLLVAGTAAFALAYAAGSAAGSMASGAVMDLWAPAASPVMVGVVLLGFTAFFLLAPPGRSA